MFVAEHACASYKYYLAKKKTHTHTNTHLCAGCWRVKWTGQQSRSCLCGHDPPPQSAPALAQEPAAGSSECNPSVD